MRIIGKIEIKNDYVVKGRKLEGVRKISSIGDIIDCYNSIGITEYYFQDVVASLYETQIDYTNFSKVLEKLFLPVTAGGGIHKLSDAEKIIECGVEKVAINSGFVRNERLIKHITSRYGSQSLSCILECRRSGNEITCYYESGREIHKESFQELISVYEDQGAGELIVISINQDGTMNGADKKLIELSLEYSKIPVVYSGGITSMNEAKNLESIFPELSGVCLNSALLNSCGYL